MLSRLGSGIDDGINAARMLGLCNMWEASASYCVDDVKNASIVGELQS